MMPVEDGSQPSTSPQLIEPERMDKLLRYMMRHGLYVASYMSMYYRTFSALHDYSSRNIDDTDFTVTFRPILFSSWFIPAEITISIRGAKAVMSTELTPFSSSLFPSPLRRWIKKYSVISSRDTEVSSKGELLGIIFASLMMRNFFVVIGSLPMSFVTGLTRNLSATFRAARSVPALIAILIVMFATGDAWRLFGLESAWRCCILLAIIVAAGIFVLTAGLRGWLARDDWPAVIGYPADEREKVLSEWVKGTPAEDFAVAGVKPELPIDDHWPRDLLQKHKLLRPVGKLSLRENMNMLLVVIAVADVIAIFIWASLAFIIVGIVAVSEASTKALTNGTVDVIWHMNLLGQSFALTRPLLLVSMTLGAIAALTFSAASVQDASSRKTFSEYALGDVRRVFGAYAYYLGNFIELVKVMAADGTLDELRSVESEGVAKIFQRLSSSQPNNSDST